MELEKLQQIIAEVLNVDASEVMPGTTFTEDLGSRFSGSVSDYSGSRGCF